MHGTKRSALLAMLVIAATAVIAGEPGWLGFGFTRHTTTSQNGGTSQWLYVRRVAPDGPAAQSALKPQDLVIAIDGKPVGFRDDAAALKFFQSVRQGQKVTFTVMTGQQRRQVTIVAAAAPADSEARWQQNQALAERKAKKNR